MILSLKIKDRTLFSKSRTNSQTWKVNRRKFHRSSATWTVLSHISLWLMRIPRRLRNTSDNRSSRKASRTPTLSEAHPRAWRSVEPYRIWLSRMNKTRRGPWSPLNRLDLTMKLLTRGNLNEFSQRMWLCFLCCLQKSQNSLKPLKLEYGLPNVVQYLSRLA